MNLKQALFNLSYFDTIGLSDAAFDDDPSTPSTVAGKLDPNLPAPDCFGFPAHVKGPLVGPEGVSKEAIKQAIDKGVLVGRLLQLLGPDYVVTDEDVSVVMYVKSKMGGPKPTVWNNDFRPLGEAPAPTPPVQPPVPPKPPIKPPVSAREAALENFLGDVKRLVARAAEVQLPIHGGGAPANALRDLIHGAQEAIKHVTP